MIFSDILNYFLAQALCGIQYIPHCNDPLPDMKIFRINKCGNFCSSKTLFNTDAFREHIETHKRNKRSNDKKIDDNMLVDKSAIALACGSLPRNFFSNPVIKVLFKEMAKYHTQYGTKNLEKVINKVSSSYTMTKRIETTADLIRAVS